MKEIAVVYWSGSGNTEQMAHDLCRGIEDAGCLPRLYRAAEFQETMMAQYENIAFGCPAMGFEELEPSEFEPMFQAVEPYLPGKWPFLALMAGERASGWRTGLPPSKKTARFWWIVPSFPVRSPARRNALNARP